MHKHLLLGMLALLSACSKQAPPADTTSAAAPATPAAATATPAPQAPASASSAPTAASTTLSAAGIGAIRFGMTLQQAEAAAGAKAELPTPLDPACSMVRFAAMPALRFMVENNIVTRADAQPGIENAVGVPFGATLADIRASHPEAQVTPHKYDENGHYVSFPGADGRSAIVLEETGGKVGKMRAGLKPAVDYVETCG